MKKFENIKVSDIPAVYLHKYKAHENELLTEHLERTRKRFLMLCDEGLENIIDSQIIKVFNGEYELIKSIILDIICLHDLGKLNPTFQKKKLRNEITSTWQDENSTHSEIGWILFQLAFWDRFNLIRNDNDFFSALVLTTAIAGHHTYAWGTVDTRWPEKTTVENAVKIAKIAGWDLSAKYVNKLCNYWQERAKSQPALPVSLFALYKTVYSALILADSTATSEQSSGTCDKTESIMQDDLKRWRANFLKTQNMKKFEDNRSKIENSRPEEINNLNELRCKILLETSKNLKNGLEQKKRVFYLEAPTGSGKTNCAINLALQTLEYDGSLKHAVFVFPFVNLIEQNADVIKKSIGTTDNDILEVYSLAEWKTPTTEEGDYSKEHDKRLFLNGKISIISSVNFIEALGSSRKSSNYKVCNISNSVIIIDEVQSIDDTKWTYLEFLLDSFANANNCYIILMSATLPRIDRIGFTEEKCEFVELLPEYEVYQKHPCFGSRTKINFISELNTVEELSQFVVSQIQKTEKPTKLLIVVNTIKRSKEVFEALPSNFNTVSGERHFDKLLLNSELLPHIKKDIIKTAKDNEKDLILVSTQCIEAGVDADFDMGIRDFAILDSIEQVAGRVNREGKCKTSNLYVIKLQKGNYCDAEKIYGKGRRWTAMKELNNSLDRILSSRDYTSYYKCIIDITKSKNKAAPSQDISGRTETKHAKNLCLHALKDFQLIKDDFRQSYFIITNIPVSAFSSSEQKIITKAIQNGFVNGSKVWEIYEKIKEIPGREGRFKLAAFSSILSKFVANKREKPEFGKPIKPVSDLDGFYEIKKGFVNSDNIF